MWIFHADDLQRMKQINLRQQASNLKKMLDLLLIFQEGIETTLSSCHITFVIIRSIVT